MIINIVLNWERRNYYFLLETWQKGNNFLAYGKILVFSLCQFLLNFPNYLFNLKQTFPKKFLCLQKLDFKSKIPFYFANWKFVFIFTKKYFFDFKGSLNKNSSLSLSEFTFVNINRILQIEKIEPFFEESFALFKLWKNGYVDENEKKNLIFFWERLKAILIWKAAFVKWRNGWCNINVNL